MAAAAATITRCQVCGHTDPAVYDFDWMFSVASNLGFGAFISPIFNISNVQVARSGGAFGPVEGAIWTTIGFAPYAVLALLVGWAIWFAIHF